MKTFENFTHGIFGGLLLLIGFFVLFANFWLGLILMGFKPFGFEVNLGLLKFSWGASEK